MNNHLSSKQKMRYVLINDMYSWKNQSLWDFLQEGNIPSGWSEFFERDDVQQQLWNISQSLNEIRETMIIYPPINQVFRAFYMVPTEEIKAILVSQDPYHSGTTEYDGSAVGLCFSVKSGNKINPSLRNIYKELKNEGFAPIENGDLTHWAKQGVLMINMALTVEKGSAGSHSCMWHQFSHLLVKYVAEKRGNDVHWLLFGKDAHDVAKHVGVGKVHMASHPSPLAAHKPCGKHPAFIGSGVFKCVPNIKW
jgi:uracil-DNA glycosylase